MTGPDRRAELAAALERLEARVAGACSDAGRDRSEVTVIAITKTFPASDVALLASLGVHDVGENRDQEAAAKAADCAAAGVTGVRWHFVGQLQTNKAGSVAGYADVVHSVDRVRLVGALDRAASRHGRQLDCLVQVDLEPHPVAGRGGAAPADVPSLCAALAGSEHLRAAGLMAVAPNPAGGPAADPDAAFSRLADLFAVLQSAYGSFRMLSAGMSDDIEAAVAHGATHLRVGRALLGSRPPLG